jgi:hypothetical protein
MDEMTPEEILAEHRREKARVRCREWRAANLEKARARCRQAQQRWHHENPEKARAKRRKWIKNNPEKRAAQKRKDSANFRPEEVAFCRWAQQGCCAICRVRIHLEDAFATKENADHCHVIGKPRGLLCAPCNSGLGFYEKYQRPRGLVIEPYEAYIRNPSITIVEET